MNQNPQLQECITSCWECRTKCQETLFNHCLQMGGEHVQQEHVKIMMDCIQICQTAADFMTRNSSMHMDVCAACAAICESCAESCMSINSDQMKRCAEICRDCAKTCLDMSQMQRAA